MKRLLMACALFIVFFPFTARAAIIASGEVLPTDPSTWSTSTTGYIGNTSVGSLTIDGDSVLLSYDGYLGNNPGSAGTVMVDGSAWVNNNNLYVGFDGNGTLDITNGGVVSDAYGIIGLYGNSTGMATVNGAGSTWTNNAALTVGDLGSGTLTITNGGNVSNGDTYIGMYDGSMGVVTVDGADSTWVCNGALHVGHGGSGTLAITNGGAISNSYGSVGENAGSTGTVTMDGSNSTWTNHSSLYVGNYGTGIITQTGGTNSIEGTLYLGYHSGGTGTYNLDGGTLQLLSLGGVGTSTFNFGGGTLKASGAFSATIPMALTGIGGNANVDTNGCDVMLSGVLSGTGGLIKRGNGILTLDAAGKYSGDTTVAGGTLRLTGGIENDGTTLIDVQSGSAILSTTNITKSNLNIITAAKATLEVTDGTYVLGDISGDGITQVDDGACLTVASLHQDTLIIGSPATPTIAPIGTGGIASIPEPTSLLLLVTATFGLLILRFGRPNWKRFIH